MTNENCDFETWYDFLASYARKKGSSAADVEAWREDYDAGKTPEEAWREAWGED